MRKSLLALGLCLLLLGLILVSVSYGISQTNPSKYQLIDYATASGGGAHSLSVQGDLTIGDTFFVNFTIVPPTSPMPDVLGVNITLTDPINKATFWEIEIGPGPMLYQPFPEGPINHTGLHKVDAEGFGINITRLDLRKKEPGEAQYPYWFLLPIGFVVLAGGAGTSLLGAKSSKPRRRMLKRKE